MAIQESVYRVCGASEVKLEHLTLTETQRTSVQLFFENGQSVEQVANIRTLKESTIVGHITEAMKQGKDLCANQFYHDGLVNKLLLLDLRPSNRPGEARPNSRGKI